MTIKHTVYAIVIVFACITGFKIFHTFKKNALYGKVIVLNGPSTSGKTSIQKEFQYLMMPHLWVKLGIDNLFDSPMPTITQENAQMWQTQNDIRWVENTVDKDQKPIITLLIGHQGERVAQSMNSAIAEYAKNGCNVIVDYIAYKKEWIDDLKNKLADIKTVWVKVNLPLETLEEREASRGTSPQGHARSHYHNVFWNIAYDLEINSPTDDAHTIAKQIKDHFNL